MSASRQPRGAPQREGSEEGSLASEVGSVTNESREGEESPHQALHLPHHASASDEESPKERHSDQLSDRFDDSKANQAQYQQHHRRGGQPDSHDMLRVAHKKELIKPDTTVRDQVRAGTLVMQPESLIRRSRPSSLNKPSIATVIDEAQLQRRLVENKSKQTAHHESDRAPERRHHGNLADSSAQVASSKSSSISSSSSSCRTHSNSHELRDNKAKSPPPAAIIIPAHVAESLSARNKGRLAVVASNSSQTSLSNSDLSVSQSGGITREQLEYGTLLKTGEVQVLYRSPDAEYLGQGVSLSLDTSNYVVFCLLYLPLSFFHSISY